MKKQQIHVYRVFLLILVSLMLAPAQAKAISCIKADSIELMGLSQQYNKYINSAAKKHTVDPYLIRSVIAIESCYNRKAVSSAGAQGLMQLIPATADRFGVNDSFDSAQNINAGTRYLRFLQLRYKGELTKVLAAYNAGEGRVDYYKGIPPYKETQRYVKNVLATYNKFRVANKKPTKKVAKKKVKAWGKPGRQGYQALRQRAPHLFKK